MAKPTLNDRIILAALSVAAKRPWHEVTLDRVAKAGKLSLAATSAVFASTDAIPPAIVGFIDAETTANIGAFDRDASPRERLFEILMARFDVLQAHRQGLLAIAEACRKSPALGLAVIQRQWQGMRTMLQLAGIEPDAPQIIGLLALYHHVLRHWEHDTSPDMAKTMATLDRSLAHAETVMAALRRR